MINNKKSIVILIIILIFVISCNNTDLENNLSYNEVSEMIENDNIEKETQEDYTSVSYMMKGFGVDISQEDDIFNEESKKISKDDLDKITGTVYYYKVELKDYNEGVNLDEAGEYIEKAYIIDYNKPLDNKVVSIKTQKPFAKITYNSFSKPIKEEIYNSENEIISITITEYNEQNHLITSEKKYNSELYLILEKEYYKGSKKLKREKVYDNFGKLVNLRILSYNKLGLLKQETFMNSSSEQNEYIRYEYINGKISNKKYYTGDGLINTEMIYDENQKHIRSNYYETGNNIKFSQVFEYYENSEYIKKVKDIDEFGNTTQISEYDKNGNQTEVINYNGDTIEKRVLEYITVNNETLIDSIKIYIDDMNKPIETTNYFYDENGNTNNWIKYDKNHEIIDSMDNTSDNY